jgi:hypothetical protein
MILKPQRLLLDKECPQSQCGNKLWHIFRWNFEFLERIQLTHSANFPISRGKGRVAHSLNKLSTTPQIRMGECRYSSVILDISTDGGEYWASRLYWFTPGESTPGTHSIGGWLGTRAGLDTVEKRKISCPCRKSKLYRSGRRYTDWAEKIKISKACTGNRTFGSQVLHHLLMNPGLFY